MARTHVVWVVFAAVLISVSCGGDDDPVAIDEAVDDSTTTVTTEEPTSAGAVSGDVDGAPIEVKEDAGLIYLSDDSGDWTLSVFYSDADGLSPLVVVIPPNWGAKYAAEEIARRGAVAVVADSWARTEAWASDPGLHLYGEMDRAACVVGWAQAHASDYGADPTATTVDGYSGGAMAAAWVGLGLADDSACTYKITELPLGLVLGENQILFHHERWDSFFESGDPEPVATLDGLINPNRWTISPDLRVGLWSAEVPIGEKRSTDNPPSEVSWMWSRDSASPFVDDFVALGALDDGRIDWSDNADLLAYRMREAGVDVRNEVFDIGHKYDDPVYDLIFSIQN